MDHDCYNISDVDSKRTITKIFTMYPNQLRKAGMSLDDILLELNFDSYTIFKPPFFVKECVQFYKTIYYDYDGNELDIKNKTGIYG